MLGGLLLNLPRGPVPAGKARREKRRRVILNDRIYYVAESELEPLLAAFVERGEEPARIPRPTSAVAPPPRAEPGPAPAPIAAVASRYQQLTLRYAGNAEFAAMLERIWRDLDEDDVEALVLH